MIHCYKDYNQALSGLKRIEYNIPCNNPNLSNTLTLENHNGVPMLHFRKLKDFPWLYQGFSTRIGGVSSGIYESMNLSFNLLDSKEKVLNNFKIVSDTIGIPVDNIVYSKQTHTTNILQIDNSHKGMGIVRDRNFDNIDGLITNLPEICLVTSFADCIPVIIADPVNRVIASLHSGWRGTVGNIARNAVDIMKKNYGCHASDLYGFIGPGICPDCYEVSSDVAGEFAGVYSDDEMALILQNGRTEGKFQLNLLMANRINLINAGLADNNIFTADICTCCNPKLLFSHRASEGKRGLMCNFIYLKGV